MGSIHHKSIKMFSLDGMIHDESAIGRLKTEYIRLLISEMRIAGYALRLDIDPDFTISYNEQKEYFTFILSVYGTYVGKKKSEWITGIDGTKVYTQEIKSNESSQAQESQSNKS
jgi:hypothetical protein